MASPSKSDFLAARKSLCVSTDPMLPPKRSSCTFSTRTIAGLRCGLEIADGPWFSDPLHALIVEAEEREFWHAVLVITDEPLRRTWCQPSDTLYVLSCNALGQVAAEKLPCGVTVIGLPFMSLRPWPRKHGPAHAVAIRGALDAWIRLKEELDKEAGRGNQDAARCASRCIEFVRELLQYVGQHGLE